MNSKYACEDKNIVIIRFLPFYIWNQNDWFFCNKDASAFKG